MSLRVWLPLNGDLRNQGLSDFTVEPLVAPTYVAGKIGKCYQRANSNSQLTNGLRINDNLVNLFGNQASIAIWVKPLGTHTHYNGTFISSGNWNASRWAFGVNQDNTKVDVLCGGYNNYIDCTVPVNEWTHLVSVFDNGTCKLYKNGIYVGEKTGQAAFKSDATWTGIGRETYASGYFGFNGCLNDLRIYDHCLSEKEIKEIAKGLILHYKLDGSSIEPTTNLCAKLVSGGRTTIVNNTVKNTGENKDTYWYIKPKEPLVGGETYTLSCYLEGFSSNSKYISWGVGSQSGNNCAGTWRTYNGYNTFTFIMPSGLNGSSANFILDDAGGTRTEEFQISYVQLEKKDHATSYVPNGTTRQQESIVRDVSGYAHNASIVGDISISIDTLRYNRSALFDGVDDCIIVPYNAICPENIFTINLWFKKDALGSKKYETLFGGPSGFEMDTRAGASTALSLYMASTRGGNAATGLQLNTWYMVTMVRDGINERYYINSELKKEIEAKAMPTGVYRIGAWASNTGQNYYGNISDFRIYCTALSADDIKELYQTSASIDDKQNFYSRELSNSLHDTTSITQAGITLADDFVEDAVAAIKDDRSIESNCFYEY